MHDICFENSVLVAAHSKGLFEEEGTVQEGEEACLTVMKTYQL